ncbi:hypothetical protein WN48_00987 [Eufriesea mexicana]|uniref:Uncharacterized protein n=1 Tax=Eufriesea mexicana TaxID=516756 RepID=A0A310SPV0_9HYME|nr:hypothetical protein WN48_00987 [Eufriesea mexicana]
MGESGVPFSKQRRRNGMDERPERDLSKRRVDSASPVAPPTRAPNRRATIFAPSLGISFDSGRP